MRYFSLAVVAVILAASFSTQAKMYKWVDEDGQMHFGDKIPPKYLVKKHDELNEQGIVIKHREAAKTAEEKAEEKRKIKELEKQKELAQKKKQRDRVLLDTYTTERDLIVARDSRIDAVDSQIRLAESIINDSKNKIVSMERQVTQIKASSRQVPDDLYRRIDIEKQQVKVQQGVMKTHKQRREEISDQFNGYLKRFNTLKEEQRIRRNKHE